MEPLSYEQTLRLRRLIAECALGTASAFEVYTLADEFANAGIGDPAIIDVLVERNATAEELTPLVRRWAEERGIPWPSADQAALELVHVVAEEVLHLGIDPNAAAYDLYLKQFDAPACPNWPTEFFVLQDLSNRGWMDDRSEHQALMRSELLDAFRSIHQKKTAPRVR